MDSELLISLFPNIYHMAELHSWAGIQKHGLLSASALLDLFETSPQDRVAVESQQRKENVRLQHKLHGEAVIRDNKPMDDSGLLRALKDMSPTEWYLTLNSKVFFWLTEARLSTLLRARAYRDRQHCVLTVNTSSFLKDFEDRIWLSPINSGATKPMPAPRGSNTFRRIKDYPFTDRLRVTRSRKKSVAELAVDYSIPNIIEYLEEVTIRDSSGVISVLYRRGS
jgi:hypothetical protein